MKAFLLLISFFSLNTYADLHCGNPKTPMEIMICSQYFNPQDFGSSPTQCTKNFDPNNLPEAYETEPYETALIPVRTGGRTRPLPGLTRGFSAEGADCTNFIRNDGTFGAWGRTVRDYIRSSSGRDRFLSPNHIQEACPRWGEMNEEEREHFWVWSIASISWDESRCVSGRRNTRATDGVATGLLQLNEDRAGRSWRGPNCKVASVASADANLKCGLDILSELLKGRNGVYRGSGALLRTGQRNTSYWEKLRRSNGGTIGTLIRSSPLCQHPST